MGHHGTKTEWLGGILSGISLKAGMSKHVYHMLSYNGSK